MSQDKQNLYEGMYVISASLSEDARKKALEKIQTGITSKGGEILKIHDQGRKRLAYQINGHREGYYYLLYFNIAPANITELWQDYHLHEDLIRFVTLGAFEVMEKIEFKPLEDEQ